MLALLLFAVIDRYFESGVFAFLAGVMWEALDEAVAGYYIFDPRGGDLTDLVVNTAGICVALILLWIIIRRRM